jgi:hypothetical protein
LQSKIQKTLGENTACAVSVFVHGRSCTLASFASYQSPFFIMMNNLNNHPDDSYNDNDNNNNNNNNDNFSVGNCSNSCSVDVNDFDVLADEYPGNVYDMDEYKKQIGNNRFDVLITMYQESFNQYYAKNNMTECDAIVQNIVQVTCRRKPTTSTTSKQQQKHHQGRFLVKTLYSVNQWRELDAEESKQFVMQALRTPALEEEDVGDDDDDDDDDEEEDDDYEEEHLSHNEEGAILEEDDLFASLPINPKVHFGTVAIPSVDFKNMGLGDNKKRGRRQSLLRRSASEDPMLLDKKKGLKNLAGQLYRHASDNHCTTNKNQHSDTIAPFSSKNKPTVRRHHSGESIPETSPRPARGIVLQRHQTVSDILPSRSLSDTAVDIASEQKRTAPKGGTIAHTIEGMDVVLTNDCQSFSSKPNIIGNNRLRVMLTLEERRFHSLSSAEQDNCAYNLVKAVTVFWKGRILSDTGFAYSILNQEESVEAMKNLLSAAPEHPARNTLGSGGISSTFNSERTTTTTASSTLSSSLSSKPISSPLLAAAPPVPEFLRNASQAILNSGKSDDSKHLSGPEQMQSAAIRSIKERAGKRQMAKSSRNTSTDSNKSMTGATKTSTNADAAANKETTAKKLEVPKQEGNDAATKDEDSSAANLEMKEKKTPQRKEE